MIPLFVVAISNLSTMQIVVSVIVDVVAVVVIVIIIVVVVVAISIAIVTVIITQGRFSHDVLVGLYLTRTVVYYVARNNIH